MIEQTIDWQVRTTCSFPSELQHLSTTSFSLLLRCSACFRRLVHTRACYTPQATFNPSVSARINAQADSQSQLDAKVCSGNRWAATARIFWIFVAPPTLLHPF